ncbi:MAG: hypothetical protein MUP28_02305 [Candidatus Aminicenantes bacterium]|nr:hypothetical protein [Candidatus Aminicenantes bacterium]
MIIKWQKSNQHTDYGLFRVGDVIDTVARGIPDEVILSWARDGFAVEEKPKAVSELRPAKKKTNIGG